MTKTNKLTAFSSKEMLLCMIVILLATHFFYYPKWKKPRTEATISWDVSGYYMYLPAFFIYKDAKGCEFRHDILKKYSPTSDWQQSAFYEKSGTHVMKYAIGQCVVFAPFFAVAHMWAGASPKYEADGFSLPYQFMISMCTLFVAIIGLIYLRLILLEYFKDNAVSMTLFAVMLGSNYLNYSAIDGAMTHNTLFTIYCLLIYTTIQFYKRPTWVRGFAIGALVGMATIVRPTELLSLIIPVLWSISFFNKASIFERLQFFQKSWKSILVAIVACIAFGSIQLIYWKYASGDWFVYSYGEQGFSWLSPHIWDGMFSAKSGWLTYSPLMVFSLIGFYQLFKSHIKIAFLIALFSFIFIYVAFAWDIWWYGGSIGQRTMVQAYPILSFPLTAFFAYFLKLKGWSKWLLSAIIALFVYLNIWFVHQAHLGGQLFVGAMTKAYYWKTIGRFDKNREYRKLLDTKEIYIGKKNNVIDVFADSTIYTLNRDVQRSKTISLPIADTHDWLRMSAEVHIANKEWDIWKMTKFIVEFKNGGEQVKRSGIRLQRHLKNNERKRMHIDVSLPDKPFTEVEIYVDNMGGNKMIEIKDIKIELFDEN